MSVLMLQLPCLWGVHELCIGSESRVILYNLRYTKKRRWVFEQVEV
jgi:hypothetical protein